MKTIHQRHTMESDNDDSGDEQRRPNFSDTGIDANGRGAFPAVRGCFGGYGSQSSVPASRYDPAARIGAAGRSRSENGSGSAAGTDFKEVILSVAGRQGTYNCLELPAGEDPLLGLIPLEDLGLEPDLPNQRLRLLPMEGKDTYLMILSAAQLG